MVSASIHQSSVMSRLTIFMWNETSADWRYVHLSECFSSQCWVKFSWRCRSFVLSPKFHNWSRPLLLLALHPASPHSRYKTDVLYNCYISSEQYRHMLCYLSKHLWRLAVNENAFVFNLKLILRESLAPYAAFYETTNFLNTFFFQ